MKVRPRPLWLQAIADIKCAPVWPKGTDLIAAMNAHQSKLLFPVVPVRAHTRSARGIDRHSSVGTMEVALQWVGFAW